MSIYLFCRKCKVTSKLGSKKCKSCGQAFPAQNKEYRVIVKFQKQTVSKVLEGLPLAQRFETMTKHELQEGRYFEAHAAPMQFSAIFAAYTAGKKNIIAEKQIRLMNVRYALYIEKVIGSLPLASIKPTHIEKLKTDLFTATVRGHKLSPTTINRVIDLVSSVFVYARKFHAFKGGNPCEAIERPKVNNTIVRYLTPEQKSALSKVLDEWYDKTVANFYRFLILTGFRVGEAYKLKWADVDLDNAIIRLVKPKTGKDQTRVICIDAVRVLTNQRSIAPGELVFPSSITGKQLTTTRHSWYTIRKMAGIPNNFRIHDLRHNFGTELASGGVQQTTIAKLLGHSQTKTTERYVHATDPAQRAAIELIRMK